MITALTIAAGVLGTAAAESLPANLGTPAIGSTTSRFNYSVVTGAVTGASIPLGTTSAWLLGLPLGTAGHKTVTVTSRATNGFGSPRWRVVANNATGTGFSASAFIAIPVSGSFTPAAKTITVPSTALPAGSPGVCFIDARLNTGASIARVFYTPN